MRSGALGKNGSWFWFEFSENALEVSQSLKTNSLQRWPSKGHPRCVPLYLACLPAIEAHS